MHCPSRKRIRTGLWPGNLIVAAILVHVAIPFPSLPHHLQSSRNNAAYLIMAPQLRSDADYLKDKTRRDLLILLEGVSKVPSLLSWECTMAMGPLRIWAKDLV